MEELSLDLNEGRVVGDGVAYTFEEYIDICGFSLEEQLCVAALSRWRTNSAEQPVDTIGANPESLAEQPGDINSAAQPVHLTASSLSSVVDGSLSYGHRFWTELNRQRGSSSRSNSSSSSTLIEESDCDTATIDNDEPPPVARAPPPEALRHPRREPLVPPPRAFPQPDDEPLTRAEREGWHTPSDLSADTLGCLDRESRLAAGSWDSECEAWFEHELAGSALLRVYARIYGFAPMLEPSPEADGLHCYL